MRKLLKISCLLTALLMSFNLYGCTSNDINSNENITNESLTETVIMEGTTEAQLNTQSIQETIAGAIKSSLEKSFGENVKINYDETNNNYIISIWKKGIAQNINAGASADEWNSMVTTLTELTSKTVNFARQSDSGANVTLQLLNDENLEKAFLQIYNGEVT